MTLPHRLLLASALPAILAVAACSSATSPAMPGGDAYAKPSWTRSTAKNAPAYTACVTNALAQRGVKYAQSPVGAGYRIAIGSERKPAATVDIAATDSGAAVTYAAPVGGDYNDQVAAGCL